MANANRPTGFSPVSYLNGAKYTGGGHVYSIDSADTNSYAVGDVVKLSGTGSAGTGIPGITRATAGATAIGVFMGAGVTAFSGYFDPANLDTTIVPATKTKVYYALILDDPNIIYEAQESGAGSNLAVTNIGENIDLISADPATGTRVSAFTINNNAHDTTSTRNFKLLRLAPRADNAIGAFAKWWVKFNNHSFITGVTGV